MLNTQKIQPFIQNRDFEISKLNALVTRVNEMVDFYTEVKALVEQLKQEKKANQTLIEDFVNRYGSTLTQLPSILELAKGAFGSPIILPQLDIQIVDNNFIVNGVNIGPAFNFRGPIGPTGPRGIQGPQGPKGEKGDPGEVILFKLRQILNSEADLPSRSAAENMGLQTTDVYLIRPAETSDTDPGRLYRYNPEIANSNPYLDDGVTPNPLYNKPFEFISNLIGAKGEKGDDGKKVVFSCDDGYIKYKYEDDNEWFNLVPLEELRGLSISQIAILEDGNLSILLSDNTIVKPGKIRRDIELKLNETENYIQWKYKDSQNWNNLISVASITGKGVYEAHRNDRDLVFTLTDASQISIPQAFPHFVVDNIQLLNYNEQPTATIEVDSSNVYHITFGIPKPKDGADGVSPKIRSYESTDESGNLEHWLQISNDGGATWENTYKLENIIAGVDLNFVDNLESYDNTRGLAASQGPVLTGLINNTIQEHKESDNPHPGKYAPLYHNHDEAYISHTLLASKLAEYSKTDHNHDETYASANHDHHDVYYTQDYIDQLVESLAPINHNHDTQYALINHSHSEYAAINHNHNGVYAAAAHTHPYAAENHNHDNLYAAITHGHSEFYTKSEVNNIINGLSNTYALKSHSHNYLVSVPYATQNTVGGIRVKFENGNLYIYTQ